MRAIVGMAFCYGILSGPVAKGVYELDPNILIQAVLYTATAFISFSLISLKSKRRSMLFLGSIIATLGQGLFLFKIFGWIYGSSEIRMIHLMGGLLVSCLSIAYHTQLVIERAEKGEQDLIYDTWRLFVDLVKLFFRILKILIILNLKKKKEEEKQKKWLIQKSHAFIFVRLIILLANNFIAYI